MTYRRLKLSRERSEQLSMLVPGMTLYVADYSSIENRVLAWFACCPGMLEVFKGVDAKENRSIRTKRSLHSITRFRTSK